MAKPVNKAKEITDARISFVSLVDKAANKRPFLIVKNEDGKAAFTTYGRIIKSDDNRHFVTGIVYEPMTEDAHGNYMTADEIAKAAFWFAKNGNKVDLQHNFVSEEGTAVVESWIAKSDCDIGGETVKEGTWLMTVEINDDSLWQSIQNGEITGLSMGGLGVYAQEDTDLSSASVTKSQGRVEKGAVTDNFKQSNTSSSFWNAFDALRSALYSYNSYTGAYTYQTDEDTIKAALEEFGTIITNLLTDASSEKPLTKSLFECKPTPELGRIEKAGRSLSAKNRETLQGLYDSLGTFLASVDADPDKDKPGGDTGTAEDDQQAEDAKAAGDEIVSAQEAVSQAYSDVRSDVEKLCEAYNTAYEAAKDSFEGQFGLFDEASTKSEDYLNSNVKAAQAALDSQLNYWNTYTANIETLKATSADDLGITEENYKALMSYVQDGSEQAAGLAASMVSAINSGNKDAVSKLANTLADVTAKQDAAAQATADWVTDYEGQLDEFQAKMEGTVDALDMSDEAGKAAKDTIAEYVQKLKDGKKDAVAAAKDVAASVALALQNSTTYTPSATPTTTVPGHAGGTTDAENVFIAGENGPELIVGKQGSTVFPTEETDRILQAISGISLDIPDRSSPESMLSGILSKAYDAVSGKNSDLSAIDAAYTGVESSVARPAAAYSSVLDSAPLNVQPAANAAVSGAQSSQNAPGETVKKIILELVGKGSVEVSGGSGSGMTANDVLELITDNIKPVLMGILKQEIFEEGQLSYEY